MTRHNLDGHLRWLLVEKACVPPPPPSIQSSTETLPHSREPDVGGPRALQTELEDFDLPSEIYSEPAAFSEVLARSPDLNTTTYTGRDLSTASVAVSGLQSMARVRTAPTPNAKLKLSSQDSKTLLEKTPASIGRSGTRHNGSLN